MDIVTLGAALNGSAEYVNSHFKGGSNIQIVDNPDGTQTINASGEVSSEDTVARAEIAAIKDGETLDSFGDVETALATKANTSTTYTKTEVDTALSAKANSADVYTKTEVDTAMSAKADKSTTYTKTEVNTALGGKVDKETGKGLSTNDYTDAEKTKLAGIAEGAEVNEIEGIKVNSSTINPDANKVVNITVPTTAADVSALPDTTKYATTLSLTINSSTFVMTGQLKDQNGDNLGTAQTIDLPLESVVVGGSYNSQTKKVVLTLQNGNTIEFSVADLVSGLQTELSANNKLNPAYINYDSTHRAVSDTEKSTWNGKQNALSSAQLDAVNSGITATKVTAFEAKQDAITSNNKLSADFVNDATTTNKFVTTADKTAWNAKQNAIDSSHKLSADLVDDTNTTHKFATAELLSQITTNENNISKDEAALVELVDGGAKSLFPNNAVSQTINSVVFVVNSDGSVTTVSGTASTAAYLVMYRPNLKKGKYVISGSDGEVTVGISTDLTASSIIALSRNGNPVEFELANDTNNLYYFVRMSTGVSANNNTVYPMICTKAAWDISHAYQPYRPSYQELYERVVALEQANQ